MEKLTDEEIMKALECCRECNTTGSIDECCHKCPLSDYAGCCDILIVALADFFNRLKAEVERLNTMHSEMCIGMKMLKKTTIKKYKEKVKEVLLEKRIFPVLIKNALNEAEKELVGEQDV